MGLFSIFKAGDAAEKAMDGIVKGVDALVLTDEEKIQYGQRATELWLKIQEAIREEGSIRSLTRRYIAIAAIAAYLLLALVAAAAFPFDAKYSAFLLSLMDSKLGWLVIGIGGFYFGPHMLGRITKKN